MNTSPAPAPEARGNRDILRIYRERIFYTLAIVIFFAVTPFAVLSLVRGHLFLGLAYICVIATFAIDGIAIHRKRRPPIPFVYLLIPGLATVVVSVQIEGLYSAVGAFPAILLCFFVLPRRAALACSLAIIAIVATKLLLSEQEFLALRFTASLALTTLIVYIITDLIRDLQNELFDQTITDPLTGAFNRRHMEMSLDEAVERHLRTRAAASVLLVDIDNFKKVNDDLGHDAGDDVLKKLVALLKARARKLDRVFRMGGEEFLVFLPDTPVAAAMTHAEDLRTRIAEANLLPGRPITVSIGVAAVDADMTKDDWIKNADNALYQAKNKGRNQVVCSTDHHEAAGPAVDDDGGRRARLR